ncbi:MAG: M56 family metallopeptidase [Pseudomonadota bacterium]
MNALRSSLAPGLAWALLDFVWQGLLVGWLAALLFALLRKARPQARYLVGCAALLLCAALPLAGLVQRAHDTVPSTLLPLAGVEPTLAAAASVSGASLPAINRLADWEQALQARLPLVILFWGSGAGLLALRMALGLAWVRRRSQPGQSRGDPHWQARATRMAQRFGIARAVRVGLVDDLPSPVTAGWWRPVVLLPAALVTGMPPDLLEALLAHELAHIKRHDYLVNLVQGAIEIVLFYHPTVWWLSNRVRIEREQIADDLAASMLGEPRRLALALSGLDQFQLTTPQLAHAAHGGNLMSRIKRLVRPESESLNWKMALPILGLSAACAAFYVQAASVPASLAAPTVAATPAQPAVAAAPAIGAPPARPARVRSERRAEGDGDAYVFVRGNQSHGIGSGNRADWRDVDALKRSVPGDFLWFRNGGKAYVVQDAGVIAKVIEAWAPIDRLGSEMDMYGKEMDQHGKVMAKLGEEMGRAAGNMEPAPGATRDFERKVGAMARQQQRLARQMARLAHEHGDGKGADGNRAQMDQLQAQMDKLSAEMAQQQATLAPQIARIESAQAPMEALGKQMEEAGKPMDELGKKMDVLGKQMDQQSKAAEKVTRGLIQDALQRGLAQPTPGHGAG